MVSEEELRELETLVVKALQTRDDSALNVLGYGEVSVALGWPSDDPRFVCKRSPPFTPAEFANYRDLVTEYITSLRSAGLAVVETSFVALERDGDLISYLVQPLLDAETLGHKILRASEPDPDHPFLAAVADALGVVSKTLSIDAQVTNFSWDGSQLTLVDVGTPFLWDAQGKLRFEMGPFLQMLPAVVRPVVKREMTKLTTRWNDPRRVGIDVVANLYREGIPEWVDPMIIALNRRMDDEPITAAEAKAFFDEDVKIWPLLKKVQKAERWWQTTVRRRPYDWFVYSSFS